MDNIDNKYKNYRIQMQEEKPMRLVVKQDGHIVSEFQSAKGPVYIGRHTNSQIFLPDRGVSRQHAVIFNTQDGKWMVEDLDSANKTYLNDQEIHKAELKTGDTLRITDFTVEVNLEEGGDAEKPIALEDTLTTAARGPQIIVRRLDSEHAPDIKLPAKRAKDFLQATQLICKANGIDEVLRTLLHITAKQFSAYHTWGALRNQPAGPMTSHSGRRRNGQAVQLNEIGLSEEITRALEKGQFLLLPRVPAQNEEREINSAMIAPIVGQSGCFGVLYVDNAMDHEHYSLGDLDYLMLLAVHTASILENF
jgi:pSer/pThr/pTyr-binding forkhead associated (FHA) protein